MLSCCKSDCGTSSLSALPELVTGNTSVVSATYGQEGQLPVGTQQLTGSLTYWGDKLPIQSRPPIDWLPILVVGGGLIMFSIALARRHR